MICRKINNAFMFVFCEAGKNYYEYKKGLIWHKKRLGLTKEASELIN